MPPQGANVAAWHHLLPAVESECFFQTTAFMSRPQRFQSNGIQAGPTDPGRGGIEQMFWKIQAAEFREGATGNKLSAPPISKFGFAISSPASD